MFDLDSKGEIGFLPHNEGKEEQIWNAEYPLSPPTTMPSDKNNRKTSGIYMLLLEFVVCNFKFGEKDE